MVCIDVEAHLICLSRWKIVVLHGNLFDLAQYCVRSFFDSFYMVLKKEWFKRKLTLEGRRRTKARWFFVVYVISIFLPCRRRGACCRLHGTGVLNWYRNFSIVTWVNSFAFGVLLQNGVERGWNAQLEQRMVYFEFITWMLGVFFWIICHKMALHYCGIAFNIVVRAWHVSSSWKLFFGSSRGS